MVAGVREIESEQHIEIVDLNRADSEMIGRELEQQCVQLQRFVDVGRIHVTAGQSLLFEAAPSIRERAAFFFEVVVAAVAFTEARYRWKIFLDALEEVEERLAIVRQ